MIDQTFVNELKVSVLKYRWFTCNCYQFQLPNGKTILMDPFLPSADSDNPNFSSHYCGFLPEDLGRVDYVLLNHTHGDHIGSLKEVYELYHPRIFCHAAYAYQLCKDLDIPQRMVFPFENEKTYHFEDFTLETYTARHAGPDNPRPMSMEHIDEGTPFEELNHYGMLFNTNFIITTPNHLRIAFSSGVFDENEKYVWKVAGIDILIRQCVVEMLNGNYQKTAKEFMETPAKLLLPLHHEKAYEKIDCSDFRKNLNQYLSEQNYIGRYFMPERGRWHEICFGIA